MKVRLLITLTASLFAVPAMGADPLNTRWNSKYQSAGAGEIQAQVILEKRPQEAYGRGRYLTQFGNGTFSQTRVETRPRQSTQPPAPGSPLPGPDSPLSGINNPNQTKFIKGLWEYQGTKGWFSWELKEEWGTCQFVGKWGYIQNGQAGPQQGDWNGTLVTNGNTGNNSSSGGSSDPVINIPD